MVNLYAAADAGGSARQLFCLAAGACGVGADRGVYRTTSAMMRSQ
jgi:hypothetical protein